MANWAYLTCSEFERIYPSFENPSYIPGDHTILQSAGCIPLLWWFMLAPEDLHTAEFTSQGQTFEETAPLVRTETAMERLHSRRDLINNWYRKNGGLESHFDLFVNRLARNRGKFISVEWQEIVWMNPRELFFEGVRETLSLLESRDLGAKKGLKLFSDVVETQSFFRSRRFLTLKEVKALRGPPQDDYWNFYRIMGEVRLGTTPWGQ